MTGASCSHVSFVVMMCGNGGNPLRASFSFCPKILGMKVTVPQHLAYRHVFKIDSIMQYTVCVCA